MIIDGHSHACGRFLTPDSIIKTLDTNGVEQTGCATHYPLEEKYEIN